MPKLTTEGGIAAFVQKEGLKLVRFKKGQRKDDVLQKKLRQFKKDEGTVEAPASWIREREGGLTGESEKATMRR